MPTLQERLADLAEDAPRTPTPPGIWAEGRRRARARRVGSAVVVALAVAGLATVGTVARERSASPGFSDQPSGQPGIPSTVYAPSGWLPVDDRPPGRLSLVIPTKRTHLVGYTWGLVGVSAVTGRYGFLDLPGYGAEGPLSPGGRRLAYYLGTGPNHSRVLDGLAVYDTTTGAVVRWRTPPTGGALQDLAWNGDDTLTFTLTAQGRRTAFSWRTGDDGAPRPTGTPLGSLAGTAGDGGLYAVPGGSRYRYRYLAPGSGRITTFRLAWPFRTIASGLAVSPSGRTVAAVHATARGSALLVGRIRPRHPRTSVHAVHSPDLQWPVVVGWADDRHVVVVTQVSPRGYDGEGLPSARYALDRVDVRTGRLEQISDVGGYWGPSLDFAATLLRHPSRDFPAPPRPLGPRVELGLGAVVMALAGAALVVWRRRVRA